MRRVRAALALTIILGAALTASAQPDATSEPAPHRARLPAGGDPAVGKRLFQEKCAQCHAIRGVGGQVGPDLGQIKEPHNVYQMAANMWNHAITMAQVMKAMGVARPKLLGDEMANLLAYLNSLEVVGDPKHGKVLFEQKRCVQCHAINGEGGKVGPDLASGSHLHPPMELAGMMWNHAQTMATLMEVLKIPRPSFTWYEMADLLSYLEAVQRETARDRPRDRPAQGR